MFVNRKLRKLKSFAIKEIARTGKYMAKDPERFNADAKKSIEQAEAQLRQAMDNDDAAAVNHRLKEYKRAVDTHLPFYRISIVREYVEAIAIALVLALFIRAFIIQAFKIPSGSMIPTLLIGDHLIVNKFIYGIKLPFVKEKKLVWNKPKRGDIIVFRAPHEPDKDFIKRVIGIPGDEIEIDENGLTINGENLPREKTGDYTYTDHGFSASNDLYIETIGEVKHQIIQEKNRDPGLILGLNQRPVSRATVPPGKYFVMGDNRDRSNDSRYWGTVDFDSIKGKAMIIYFSWPPRQLLRFGKLVK